MLHCIYQLLLVEFSLLQPVHPKPQIYQPWHSSVLAELAQWVEGQGDNLPSFVKVALEYYQVLAASFAGSDRKMRALLDQLRRAMGFIPSSERRKSSGDPIGATAKPNDPKPKDPASVFC